MKKLFALLITLSLLLCGCKSVHSSEVLARVVTESEDAPGSRLTYFSDAVEGSEHYLDKEHMSTLYGENTDINSLCADYAILIGAHPVPWEVHILHARSASGVAELLDALSRRKDLLALRKNSTFSSEISERTTGAKAYSNGTYVILLVTSDNDKVISIINRAL